jgi:hypothetical protein
MTFIQSGTRLVRNSPRLQNPVSRTSPQTSSSNLDGGTPNSRSLRFVSLDLTSWIVAEGWVQILPDTPGSTYEEELPSPDYDEGALVRPINAGGSRPSLENPFDRPTNESGPSRGLSIRQPSLDSSSNGRRPSNADTNPFSLSSLARKTSESAPAPSTATSGVVIPNKSTIAEEEIQVPYGRDDGPDSMQNSEVRDSVASDDVNGPDEAPTVGGLNAIGNSKWNAKNPSIASLQSGFGALGKKLGGTSSGDDDGRNRSTSNATLKGRLDGRPVSSPFSQPLLIVPELTCC